MLRDAAADDEVRVVVLTGAGGAFGSGADLSPGGRDEGWRPCERSVRSLIDRRQITPIATEPVATRR